jgi:hypothetical protein
VLANHDRAAAAPTDTNQVTDSPDVNGGTTNSPDPGSGGVIQPPVQPPTHTHGRSDHLSVDRGWR